MASRHLQFEHLLSTNCPEINQVCPPGVCASGVCAPAICASGVGDTAASASGVCTPAVCAPAV